MGRHFIRIGEHVSRKNSWRDVDARPGSDDRRLSEKGSYQLTVTKPVIVWQSHGQIQKFGMIRASKSKDGESRRESVSPRTEEKAGFDSSLRLDQGDGSPRRNARRENFLFPIRYASRSRSAARQSKPRTVFGRSNSQGVRKRSCSVSCAGFREKKSEFLNDVEVTIHVGESVIGHRVLEEQSITGNRGRDAFINNIQVVKVNGKRLVRIVERPFSKQKKVLLSRED